MFITMINLPLVIPHQVTKPNARHLITHTGSLVRPYLVRLFATGGIATNKTNQITANLKDTRHVLCDSCVSTLLFYYASIKSSSIQQAASKVGLGSNRPWRTYLSKCLPQQHHKLFLLLLIQLRFPKYVEISVT